jgi:hypothetical protein
MFMTERLSELSSLTGDPGPPWELDERTCHVLACRGLLESGRRSRTTSHGRNGCQIKPNGCALVLTRLSGTLP